MTCMKNALLKINNVNLKNPGLVCNFERHSGLRDVIFIYGVTFEK